MNTAPIRAGLLAGRASSRGAWCAGDAVLVPVSAHGFDPVSAGTSPSAAAATVSRRAPAADTGSCAVMDSG